MTHSRYLFFILLILMSTAGVFYGQDAITQSQGSIDLLLNHEENALNLYNLTGNTGFMAKAISRNFYSLSFSADYAEGHLKRLLDPRERRIGDFWVYGAKKISDRQMIWASAKYNLSRFNDLPYALEPNPYDNDPLVLRDTTVAGYHYSGQEVAVKYQFLFNPKFSLGTDLFYNISQGLKNEYSRARNIHRDVLTKLSLYYRLNSRFQLGSYFTYNDVQDQIEMEKTRIDGQSPRIFRYRSEEIYREKIGNFTHYDKRKHYISGVSLVHQLPAGRFTQILNFEYEYEDSDIFDGTSKRDDESRWYCDKYQLNYQMRKTAAGGRWNYGLKFRGDLLSSFSEHPEIEILITKREVQSNLVEAGIRRMFPNRTLRSLGVQLGYYLVNDKYTDHQIHIVRDLKHEQFTAKIGGAIQVNEIHQMLFGFNFGGYRLDEYGPRYLPEHDIYRFTLGFVENRLSYDAIANLEMFVRQGEDNFESYSGFRFNLMFKIFKN